jgi:tripartite-type tricarboxylate transporter receptor subunit TctC
MNRAIGEFLKKADMQDRLDKIGLASSGTGTPDEVQAYIRKGQAQWKALAQELGIEAQ